MNNLIPENCDRCGKPENPTELYVVPGNLEYLFFCQDCFDQIDVNEYFMAIRAECIKDVYTAEQFESHKNYVMAIGFSRGAAIDPEAVLPADFEARIVKEIEGEFLNRKLRNKFEIISHRPVLQKHTDHYYEVKITAKVKHKNYKQYLEHEAYMFMRKEVNFTVQ